VKGSRETNAATWTLSNKWREMNPWGNYISSVIGVSKEFDADFNFSTTYFMSHWVKQISRYGALQEYSSLSHELAHQPNLQQCWNACNHDLNYMLQVITFQRCILCFEITELNLPALAQRREISTTTCKVLYCSSELDAPLGSRSYAKPEFIGPQTAAMVSILVHASKTSKYYLTIHKTQCSAC